MNESQFKLIEISQRNICEKSAQYFLELYKMGSAPSSPSQESNTDPWWSIENQTLELNPPEMNSNRETNAEQSQQTNANGESGRADDLAVSSSESEPKNESIDSTELGETNENNPENLDKHCASSSEVTQSNENQTLEEFKEELRIKRELRKCAISELRNEMSNLRHELAQEKALNKKLMAEKRDCRCFMTNRETETTEDQINLNASALRTQLSAVQYSLQLANAEILSLTMELSVTKRQTQSLKDVVAATKQMLEIRENELNQVWLQYIVWYMVHLQSTACKTHYFSINFWCTVESKT